MTTGTDPVRIGVLFDYPQADDLFERTLRHGIETAGGATGRDVDLVTETVRGLPYGSEHEVVAGYRRLVDAGAIAVVGPSISDNALIVRDLAASARTPTVNWSGGERTRGEWMFHYQVGSLEEEPIVLAQRMVERRLTRAAVVYDRSPVGRGYLESLQAACERFGVELAAAIPLSPTADETGEADVAVGRARSCEPDCLVYFGLGAVSRAVALAIRSLGWTVPVLAGTALMFGYARPDWRDAWSGWEYVDMVADDNEQRAVLADHDRRAARGPIGCAAFDIGRVLACGLQRCDHLTRSGLADGLRRVKRLPAATGEPGTTVGFGVYDHAALAGPFLVLRQWSDGRSVAVAR